MSISTTLNSHGLLDVWREYMREDIWHFNQIMGRGAPTTNKCTVYLQDEREHLARSLSNAFQMVKRELGYAPMPVWGYGDVELESGVPYQRQLLRLGEGYAQAFGQRAATLIEADVDVVYDDPDGDTIPERATITVTSTYAADEIQVFFREADGAWVDGDELWQIQPLKITKDGDTVTIRGHRSLFVNPAAVWNVPHELSEDVNMLERHAGDTQTVSDFVDFVDVYRVYNDTTTPVQFRSDAWLCGDADATEFNEVTGTVQLVESDVSLFRVRHSCSVCPGYPERVRVYYKAGFPLNYGHIDHELGTAIVRLANAIHPLELPCALCDRTQSMWATDRKVMPAEELNAALVGNPFGLRRGEVEAWKIISRRALGRGGKLG